MRKKLVGVAINEGEGNLLRRLILERDVEGGKETILSRKGLERDQLAIRKMSTPCRLNEVAVEGIAKMSSSEPKKVAHVGELD